MADNTQRFTIDAAKAIQVLRRLAEEAGGVDQGLQEAQSASKMLAKTIEKVRVNARFDLLAASSRQLADANKAAAQAAALLNPPLTQSAINAKKLLAEINRLKAQKAFTKLKSGSREYAKALRNATKETNRLSRKSRTLTEELKRVKSGFGKAGLKAGIFSAVVIGAGAALLGFAKAGEGVSSVEDTFKELGGTLADIERLKEATQGLVSDTTIQRLQNQANLVGINAKELDKFAQIAVGASRATGLAIEDTFTRLVSGVAKQEKELLDELGIKLNDMQLVYKNFAASIGKSKDELTAQDKQVAFTNEVLANSMTQLALGTKKVGAPVQKLSVAFENMKNEAAKATAVALDNSGAIEILDDVMKGLVASIPKVVAFGAKLIKTLIKMGPAFELVFKAAVLAVEGLSKFADGVGFLGGVASKFAADVIPAKEGVDDLGASVGRSAEALKKANFAGRNFIDTIRELPAAAEETRNALSEAQKEFNKWAFANEKAEKAAGKKAAAARAARNKKAAADAKRATEKLTADRVKAVAEGFSLRKGAQEELRRSRLSSFQIELEDNAAQFARLFNLGTTSNEDRLQLIKDFGAQQKAVATDAAEALLESFSGISAIETIGDFFDVTLLEEAEGILTRMANLPFITNVLEPFREISSQGFGEGLQKSAQEGIDSLARLEEFAESSKQALATSLEGAFAALGTEASDAADVAREVFGTLFSQLADAFAAWAGAELAILAGIPGAGFVFAGILKGVFGAVSNVASRGKGGGSSTSRVAERDTRRRERERNDKPAQIVINGGMATTDEIARMVGRGLARDRQLRGGR